MLQLQGPHYTSRSAIRCGSRQHPAAGLQQQQRRGPIIITNNNNTAPVVLAAAHSCRRRLCRQRHCSGPPSVAAAAPWPAQALTTRARTVCAGSSAGAGGAGDAAPTAAAAPEPPSTAQLEEILTRGTGLARRVLAESSVDGDPLAALRATEAYWAALRRPRKRGGGGGGAAPPAVVTVDAAPLGLPRRLSSSGGSSSSTNGSSENGAHTASSPPAAAAGHDDHDNDNDNEPVYDAVVCGGTLGLLPALALAARGWRVAVVERRRAEGREQEWNTSRGELAALAAAVVLPQADLDACVTSAYGPSRVGFRGGADVWVDGVLDIGVSPRALLARARRRLEALGGVVYEHTEFRSASVRPDGVRAVLAPARGGGGGGGNDDSSAGASPPRALRARLLLDCMGHYGPIVKQLRGAGKPDGMVVVVGGAADGYDPRANTTADLLYTFTDAAADVQLFWEAFPADVGDIANGSGGSDGGTDGSGSGGGGGRRTTYMFAYLDAAPSRPDFEKLLDAYFELLPAYQGVPLSQLRFKRVLMGGFPCYRAAPLRPGFDRILQLGDAGAAQSPLSFGGFGSMLRHMPRLARALDDALRLDRLARGDLAWAAPYSPPLSCAWLFQRSMSVPVGAMGAPKTAPAADSDGNSGDDGAAAGANAAAAAASGGIAGALARFVRAAAAAIARAFARLAALPAGHVNAVLRANFAVSAALGPRALKPFLQDTVRLGPLTLTMLGMALAAPLPVARVVLLQVGPAAVAAWFAHYAALAACAIAHVALAPLRAALARFGGGGGYLLRRLFEAAEYGCGGDYRYHHHEGDGNRAATSVDQQRANASAGPGAAAAAANGVASGARAGADAAAAAAAAPAAAFAASNGAHAAAPLNGDAAPAVEPAAAAAAPFPAWQWQ